MGNTDDSSSREQVSGRVAFVSHASEDHDTAAVVCAGLESAGISCWVAPRDIPAGQRYAKAIIEAIENCRIFLLVFGEHSNASPHVRNEIERAASLGLPIVLFRIDSTDPSQNKDISLFLASHQWYDASTGPLDEHVTRLLPDLRRIAGVDRNGDAGGAPTKPSLAMSKASREPRPAKGSAAADSGTRRAIGIDLGSTKIRACIRDMGAPDRPSPRESSYVEDVRRPATARSLIEQVRAMIERILDAEHLSRKPPIGIGLAVPGQVDVRAGTLKFGPGLGVRNVPFRTALANAYPDIPVIVDNDARCATRCELHLGVGKDFESFVCIFIGTGVGSGAAINRQILFGQNYCAGEIGHTKISSSGPPCSCGQVGCLETFVKGPAIAALATSPRI